MEPLLIGYFPGYTNKRTQWLKTPIVEEICSANRGHFHLPKNWFHQRRHNALLHFDSEETAWTVLQDDILIQLAPEATSDPPWRVDVMSLPCAEFDLYAYKVFPVRYREGRPENFPHPPPPAVPIPADYRLLGYDVVSWSGTSYFECCPLFCNGDARTQPVNRHCLLEQPALALELARFYSAGNWEPGPHYCGRRDPGPYCVVEVWRKAKPFAEPRRSGEPFRWPPDLLLRLVQHTLAHGGVYQ